MRIGIVATLLAGTASLPAWAQQQTTNAAAAGPAADSVDTQEIIVTATKRNEELSKVPFSINAQTEADLQRANARSIEDVSRLVAGLTIQNLGPGQSQVAIRGVAAGQIVRDQPGVKEQVGIYLDESVISLSLFTPDLDLFDLNRVETLRGPQGTLFGSGSVGGTIRYITNQPKLNKNEGLIEGNVNVLQGGDVGGSMKAAVNVVLAEDKAAVRIVGYYTHYAGFIRAFGPAAGNNINDGDRSGARIALTLKPTETLTITPRVIYQHLETNGFNRQEVFNLYSNPFTNPPRILPERSQYLLLREKFRDDTFIFDNTINWDIGPATVTSVTTYTDRKILVGRDASALTASVSIDLGLGNTAANLPSNLRDTTSVQQVTQELRIASNGSGPFNYVIGGFYTNVDRFYRQRLPTPGYDPFVDARFGPGTSVGSANGFPLNSPYNSDIPYKLEQYAAFGELSYRLERLLLTAGARYYSFNESRNFVSGGLFSNGDRRIGDKTSSDGATPRFIASYDVTDRITVNAQASQGFRLGGVNDPLNANLCTPADRATFGNYQNYRDETLWNYEGNIKGRFRGFRFSAAGFYNDISNLQVTLDAGSCSSRVVFNVPKAHTAGFEGEFTATPLPGLDIGLSTTVLEARFDSTVVGGGTVLIQKGWRLPTVPEFTFAANATYSWPIQMFGGGKAYVNGSIQHIGSRFTQPPDQRNGGIATFVSGIAFNGAAGTGVTTVNLKLPDYQILNLSTGVELSSGVDVGVYVNNVLDQNPLLSFDRERGGRARLGYNVGSPREVGLTARKRF
ncbi:MAG: TonB-dependent receptor [Sphingomonadaceae bacterium]|nr:TonB-dependent receptor [Sphingomonadaceae bacterium]